MYYDLNIQLTANTPNTWLKTVRTLQSGGYKGIAINRSFDSKLPSLIPPLPESLYDALSSQQGDNGAPAAPLRIYSRITLVLDSPSINFGLHPNNAALKHAHIIAVRPTTEKLFQLACTQLEIDLISLQLDEKLPFHPKHAIVGAAMSRGIHFELCYKDSLTDTIARRNFMSNVMNLISVTRGKNLIVTSGAEDAFGVRSPADAMNLVTCLGLDASLAKQLVVDNPRNLLYHAATRKWTYKGVVALEPTQTHPATREEKDDFLAQDFISFSSK